MVRVLRDCDALIDRGTWELPGLFRLLTDGGRVERDEAFRAFNMGVGAVLFVEPEEEAGILDELNRAGERAFSIGETTAGTGEVK